MSTLRATTCRLAALVVLPIALFSFSGCDNKEKVIDIETPRRDVEVERDRDTGEVEVDVEKKE